MLLSSLLPLSHRFRGFNSIIDEEDGIVRFENSQKTFEIFCDFGEVPKVLVGGGKDTWGEVESINTNRVFRDIEGWRRRVG